MALIIARLPFGTNIAEKILKHLKENVSKSNPPVDENNNSVILIDRNELKSPSLHAKASNTNLNNNNNNNNIEHDFLHSRHSYCKITNIRSNYFPNAHNQKIRSIAMNPKKLDEFITMSLDGCLRFWKFSK